MKANCVICGNAFTTYPCRIKRSGNPFCSIACSRAAHPPKSPEVEAAERRAFFQTDEGRAKKRAHRQAYKERHADQLKEANKQWREANKDYVAAKNRAYRAAHPGEDILRTNRWREAHPDQFVAGQRAASTNARARAAGAEGHLTRADVTALWERQPVCISCGKGRGIDHIISYRDGGQNVPSNIQNLCRWCNADKERKLTKDQVRQIRTLYAAGGQTYDTLAARFNITRTNIAAIVLRKLWKHVV